MTWKKMQSISSDITCIVTSSGSSWTMAAAPDSESANSIQSFSVEYRNSAHKAKTVASTVKIIIIIGMKLGERK